MEISITRALNELRLLNKRINDKINSSYFLGCAKRSSEKVNNVFTKDEFKELIKSNYDSISSLIKRRSEIKAAIVASNAVVKVKIADIEMTVAEAIERKNTIEYEETLLDKMESQYNNIIGKCNNENEKVNAKADEMINTMLGKVEQNKKDQYKAETELVQKFIKDNEFETIDPIDLRKKIENLKEKIDGFKSEVDLTLSEINAVTKIIITD
jgi:hypothetical protein